MKNKPQISDDDELHNTPILKVKMAANHLCELRDFAIAHKKPDLLQLVTKSQTIVEETMWDEIKTAKQTKITSFMNKHFHVLNLYYTCIIAHVLCHLGGYNIHFLATPITTPTSCERPPLLKDQISLNFVVISQKRDYCRTRTMQGSTVFQWHSHAWACPGTGPGNLAVGPGNKRFELVLKFNCMSTSHGL